MIRNLFGNPFRPSTFESSWLSSGVLATAREIDCARDYGRMPELAGLLAEAGCDDAAILGHCRDGGLHARGC